jgi:cytochrome P450
MSMNADLLTHGRVGARGPGNDSPVAATAATGRGWCPPRTRPLAALVSLARVVAQGDGDLLSLVPAKAYRVPIGHLGYSRRSTLIVNAPELVRRVMHDEEGIFPKSDLMVGALEPLVGHSMFVSGGDTWRRQRRMLDPAFTQLRVTRAFGFMNAALDAYDETLQQQAASGEAFSLDLAMSHLTADIICRTVFSTSFASTTAREVFDAFAVFERSVAQVNLWRLIFDAAGTRVPQKPEVLAACARIREQLGRLLDPHLAAPGDFDDIAADIIAARDAETGAGFTRAELLDQLGVMFLAGHETTASALTWALFIIAMQPQLAERMREEVRAVAGARAITVEDVKRLAFVRNVFRETVRLYPPITFMPRMAAQPTTLGGLKVKRGALLMISPWTIQRHEAYWPRPHEFDPDRFSAARESELVPGTYLPFGLGPRLCIGAAFATTEATLILARLVRDFDFSVLAPERVRPAARLTTRPAQQILCRVRRRPQ